ncbi:MAG: hypothetical protein IPM69_03535 [Ignavibacteria bacterium]|nr:hypothetical protein [Ignavibacteria bacterium]
MNYTNTNYIDIRQLGKLSFLVLFVFMFSFPSAQAQDEETNANELELVSKVSGSGSGGGLNVSNYNGNVAYTYPISQQTVGGYPLSVTLDYSSSVSHNHFFNFRNSSTYSNPYQWWTFNKVAPAWLLSVNGFVVQSLSAPNQFNNVIPLPYSDMQGHAKWLIEGYDYCNRLHLLTTGKQDVIKILRSDGGLLELRNPYLPNTAPYGNDSLKCTGRYYSNSVNDKSYGYVHFDSTNWPSYLKIYAPQQMTDRYKFIPRILHYYQGDGLEYIFREHTAPYGNWDPALGGFYPGCAAPTIFYLEEIRSGEQTLTTFKYNRHYPTETNIDTTVGRAMISEFQGHRISLNNVYMTIEALGHTYKVRYKSTNSGDPFGSIRIDSTLLSVGIIRDIGSKYGDKQKGGSGDKSPISKNIRESSSGFVTEILDPLDRSTKFEYKIRSKRYEDKYTVKVGTLTKIKDASGYTTIDYHNPNLTWPGLIEIDSMQTYVRTKLEYDFNNIAGKVKTYNNNNTLLSSSTYLFDNNPSGYNRKSKVINEDPIAVLKDTTEYYYSYEAVTPYIILEDSVQEVLSWTPLEKKIHYSHSGVTTTFNLYGGASVTGTRFLYVPIESKTLFESATSSSSIIHKLSHKKFEYQFTTLHDFGVDSTFGALMARNVAKQKDIIFYPYAASLPIDTLYTTTTEYIHLPLATSTISRTDSIWDYKRSWFLTDSLRAIGIDTTVLAFQTNTISSASVIAPPIWELMAKSFVIKSGDTLSGAMNGYQTTLSTTAPRGSLLSDTLRGGNGVIQKGDEITYKGGWYRNTPVASININGSKTESLFDYTVAPLGTLVTTSAQRLSSKLFNLRNELEAPLGGRNIVRKPLNALGSITSDTLLGYTEYGYYGNTISSIDANGYYSASDYDDGGRARMSWQAFDFPPFWSRNSDRIRLYDTRTLSFFRHDTLYLADTSYGFSSWTESSNEAMRLYCNFHEYIFLYWPDTNMVSEVGISNLDVGKIIYHANTGDRLHSAEEVTGVTLSMYISVLKLKHQTWLEDNQSVRLSIPRLGFSETYIFGSYDSLFATQLSGLSAFNVTLPSDVVDSLVAMVNGDTISILIEALDGNKEFEILALSDDLAPAFVVSGSTSSPKEADFSSETIYNDSTLSKTTLAKIDDTYRTSNTDFELSIAPKFGRYVGGISEYDKEHHAQQTIGIVGNPFSPTRLDTTKSTMTGTGIPLINSDPEGRSTKIGYNFAHNIDTLFFPDLSRSITTRESGYPPDLGVYGQEFYSFCSAQYTESTLGITTAKYNDAFGRLRKTVADKNGLSLTVKYEYDLMGNISSVISPKGDTTSYWYDNWGHVRSVYQPDIGTISYAYDKKGNIRYSQNERQAEENKISFIQYDDLDRITLKGEAKLSSDALTPLQSYSSSYPIPAPSVRLTDCLDAGVLHISTGTPPPVTVNTSLYKVPDNYPATLTINSDTTPCLPSPGSHLSYEIGPIQSPYLKRSAQYWVPVTTPTCNWSTFESVSIYPENVLQVTAYDKLPQHLGAVWSGFPANNLWDSLAPTGVVRHLLGRTSASAYRQNNGQPFHYLVYSYDERGRVEAVLRFTENLGFEAVYYTYNSANLPIRIRTADPFNQHVIWYSYDMNGRMDTVYSSLSEGKGVGWINAKRPSFTPTKPSDPDAWYSYARRGYADTIHYATTGGVAKIVKHLDILGRLDTLISTVDSTNVFTQNFTYTADGDVRRRDDNGIESYYWHDPVHRLVREVTGSDTVDYRLDQVGNRTCRVTPIGLLDTLFYTGNQLTEHRRASDTTLYSRDSEGAVTGMTTNTQGEVFVQKETLGYDASGLNTRYVVKENAVVGSCLPRPMTLAQDSVKDWRYRHGTAGLREQRRLYYSPFGDSCFCNHEWTYYLRGANQEVRTVWSGRQTADPDTCGNSDRRVVYYPVEYMGAGGGYYTRDWDGTWRKEFRITDNGGSIRAIVRGSGNTNFNYSPFGTADGPTERWSFIGQEKDIETVGLNEFGYRKYNAQTGQFLRPDPLWASFPDQSPFQYAYNSPLSWKDPNGLTNTGIAGVTEKPRPPTWDAERYDDYQNEKKGRTRGGGGAWTIKNKWGYDYIQKFRSFSSNQAREYEEQGLVTTCEDFAIRILVDFASANNLPLQITNGVGTFDASSDDFNTVNEYLDKVLTTTGAPDLQLIQNTVATNLSDAESGDLILVRRENNVAKHIQMVIFNNDLGVGIIQGTSNFLNRIPGASAVLGAGNPKSMFYTGKRVEQGIMDRMGNYSNLSNGNFDHNFPALRNIEVREWNFFMWNK